MGTPAASRLIRVGGSSEVEGYISQPLLDHPEHLGFGRPNPFCRCTHWKPSCFVMAAIAIEPPTVLGRAMENFTKPIVVSTRKRARSTASRMGMASTKRSSNSAGESLAWRSRAASGVSPLPAAASSKSVPSPKIRRLSASYSPSHRMPKSCSPCTWVGAGELGPSSSISQTSASGRSAE